VARYGRSASPPATHEERQRARCEKCAHLEIDGKRVGCAEGRELGSAATCTDYDDRGRDRDYRPHFQYDGRFRR